jgi:hypothetical protein
MTAAQIQTYIGIASLLASAGVEVAGKFKALIGLFHPTSGLTEEQINAIEQAGIADAQRRQQERIAMGQPSEA